MWKTLDRQFWRGRGILITVPSVAIILIGVRSLGLLQAAELSVLDLFFQLRPPEPSDERVVIVEINETDIQKVGYPISDGQLANVLSALKQQRPRAIGLDLYRDVAIGSGRPALLQLFKSTPNLLGIQFVGKQAEDTVKPPRELEQTQFSSNNLVPDSDGKIRRNLLLLDDRQGQPLMTLGAQAALLYLDAEGIELQEAATSKQQYRLGKAVFQSLAPDDGGYVQADAGGFQLLSNFRNLKRGFRTLSLSDVLAGKMPADFARDRVVLIGVTAISVGDFLLTPYSSDWLGREMSRTSGVLLHADLASQLISAALDNRPLLQVWSKSIEDGWIAGWSLVGAIVVGLPRSGQFGRKRKPWTPSNRVPGLTGELFPVLSLLIFGTGLMGSSYLLFLQGWWVPVVPGMLALAGAAIATNGYRARQVTRLHQKFGPYLTDDAVAHLLATRAGKKMGGERCTVTVLMAEFREVAALSEQLLPNAAVTLLNRSLAVMVEVIADFGGTLSQIPGDRMVAVFGAPIPHPDHAERAITCAIALQSALADFNTQNQSPFCLELGIGIHTGEVLAGNIGSQQRASYTVMGKTVHLAAHILSWAVGGQVVISQSSLKLVSELVQVGEPLQVEVKGVSDTLTIYEVEGIRERIESWMPHFTQRTNASKPSS